MMVNFPRKPKICNLKSLIMNQDIFRFDIPMHNVAIVQNFIPLGKLFQKSPDNLIRTVMILLDIALKRASIAVFHDQIEIMLGGDLHFDTINEIFMVWDLL